MKVWIFLCFTFLTYINCQAIVDSSPVLDTKESIIRDFKLIPEIWSALLENTTYNDILNYTDLVSNRNATINSIKFDSLTLDTNSIDVSFYSDGSTKVSGPSGSFLIQFNFTYAVNSSNFSHAGFTLNFGNFDLVLTEKNDKIFINLIKTPSYVVNNIQDDSNKLLLTEALSDQFDSDSFPNIFDSLLYGINSYYLFKISNTPSINFKTQYPEQNVRINMNKFVGICKLENEVVTCPYSGNVDAVHSGLFNDSLNDIFIKDTNEYKVFVHYKLINDILENLVKNDSFSFTLNSSNKPNNLPYNLDIQSFGQLFPDLYDDYSRSQSIKIKNTINKINIYGSINRASGLLNIISSVYLTNNDSEEILKFSAEINFTIKIPLLAARLNFCIDNLNLGKVQILSDIKTSYIGTFKSWISSTFHNYLADNNYCISNGDLNLNDYFKYITSAIQSQKGIYIIGKSLYSLNSDTGDKIKTLKFLQ